MKLSTVLLIEVIVFMFFSTIIKRIKYGNFYRWVLEQSKIPNNRIISVKEEIAYIITKLVCDLPTFSFAPSDYEIDELESEIKECYSIGEKLLLGVFYLVFLLRRVVGNVLFDMILFITVLQSKGFINFVSVFQNILSAIRKNSMAYYIGFIGGFISLIQNNASTIILLVVLLTSIYIGFIEHKKRRLSIEAVWAEEEADRVRKVAGIQKEMENMLLMLRVDIYKNMKSIRRIIGAYRKRRDPDNTEQLEKSIEIYLIDYQDTTNKINDLLVRLHEAGGNRIFIQRNMQICTQLELIDLLPTLTDKATLLVLNKLSKGYVKQSCKTTEDLCKVYAYGVSIYNGITRFLKFSYKKNKQYNRLIASVEDARYIETVAKKIEP